MQLLNIEWLKIRKYTTFWVLVGLFTGLFFMWTYGISSGVLNINDMLKSSFAFPSIWANLGYLYSWFVIFLCVFVIISITNEFTFKTHRQNVIDGQSRMDFLHAKMFLILAITLSATLFFIVIGLIFGFANGGGNPFEGIEKIIYVFLFTLNYLSFSALLAFFIRRSGLSIILLLAYFLMESILGKLINMKLNTQVGNFFPLQSSDELLPWNALKSMANMVGTAKADLPNYAYLIASCVWIGIYYFVLRKKMTTSDL